ncbi:hypothetical protein F5Y17DRAFT_333749 [Xylariaceae sp. FL0594]|nr:hypothetical protein F5Y17DRAFT_333749 [Xylariaceae sp. FL0594]
MNDGGNASYMPMPRLGHQAARLRPDVVFSHHQPFYGSSSAFSAINAPGAVANYMGPASSVATLGVVDPYPSSVTTSSSPPGFLPVQPFLPQATAQQEREQSGTQRPPPEQQQQRPKRKSKYTDEPPRSLYGPPFVTKLITADMTEEQAEANRQFNERVSEAKKIFNRHKNNMAAKKSRQKKEALIEELSTEKAGLEARLRATEELNRQLRAEAQHHRSVEDENARLRQENQALHRHAEELEARLQGVAVERQRDADRLDAMLAVPHGHNHAGMSGQGLKHNNGNGNGQGQGQAQREGQVQTPSSSGEGRSPSLGRGLTERPRYGQESGEDNGSQKAPAAGMNTGMDSFLVNLHDGVEGAGADGDGEINWDSYH